jgi:hypothetical protein
MSHCTTAVWPAALSALKRFGISVAICSTTLSMPISVTAAVISSSDSPSMS